MGGGGSAGEREEDRWIRICRGGWVVKRGRKPGERKQGGREGGRKRGRQRVDCETTEKVLRAQGIANN